jgi:hypothetical protein
LKRDLTEQERRSFRALSFMSLEALYGRFISPKTTPAVIEETLAYLMREDRPNISYQPRKRPLWRRLLGI